jgi:hypothetical protein
MVTLPFRVVQRARIVLYAAEGMQDIDRRMGALQLGLGSASTVVAARIAAIAAPVADGPPAICHSNFDVVAPRTPRPGERLVLELSLRGGSRPGARVETHARRGSLRPALRAPGRHLAALAGLCREALPQNVARTVEDWVRDVRAAAPALRDHGRRGRRRLRRAPARRAARRPRGRPPRSDDAGRPASRLRQVEQALAAASEELEAGLDRVSGRWLETPSRSHGRTGRVVVARRRGSRSGRAADLDAARWTGRAGDRFGACGPCALAPPPTRSLPSWRPERGGDVFVVYAGARAVSERVIIPLEIDEARVRAYCHLRGDERSFWLSSIPRPKWGDGSSLPAPCSMLHHTICFAACARPSISLMTC